MDLIKHLSQHDSSSLLELIDACVYCRDSKEFGAIIEKLKTLIAFQCAAISYSNYNKFKKGQKNAIINMNHRFPEKFMQRYFSEELFWDDVPVIAFIKTFKLQNWTQSIKQYNSGIPTKIDLELKDRGIHDGWVYGARDHSGAKITTISLGSEIIENNHRTQAIIKLATPHIFEAYKRIIQIKEMQKYHLTNREIEVLNWLKVGKTSWEISVILNISERCVNFHINNAKAKLDAVNRTQAVAVALGTHQITL